MEWPLNIAAVIFLVAYAWPILQPSMGSAERVFCEAVIWCTWGLFVMDFLVKAVLSKERLIFFRRHVLDVLVIVLPLLRPLRLLRLVAMLNILNRSAALSLRGKVVVYVVGSTVLVVFCAALAELEAERAAGNSTIQNFPDAVWWAITTITTVGYGDRYPVTTTGRLIAVGLMIAGIALLGVVTASFAAWLVQRVADAEEGAQMVTLEHIAELTNQIEQLRVALSANVETPPRGDPAAGRL
jgi:voltage-gated potassium channel